MRITREMLFKLAQDTVNQRARADRDILAVYLHGSLLEDEPLLAGTTDIDLFFVHNEEPAQAREIVRITDEVHVDISHHSRRDYRQPKDLRVHPWLGPTLFSCKILYDPQHFLDFVQASVRGQFERPDHVLERARPQVEHARQIWLSFTAGTPPASADNAALYLRAIDHTVNAVNSLSGGPLTERRFLLNFPARAAAVHRPGLYAGLLGLLGAPAIDADTVRSWLPAWRRDYDALPKELAAHRFDPGRKAYYLRAFENLVENDLHQVALWPLVRTWTHIAQRLHAAGGDMSPWETAATQLGVLGPAFTEKVAALDAYLDMVEELLEEWGRENGA